MIGEFKHRYTVLIKIETNRTLWMINWYYFKEDLICKLLELLPSSTELYLERIGRLAESEIKSWFNLLNEHINGVHLNFSKYLIFVWAGTINGSRAKFDDWVKLK